MVIAIGSRTGALLGLIFFALVFGMLAIVVASQIRRRGSGMTTAGAAGLAVVILPVGLFWMSSVSGFYDVRIAGHDVVLMPFVLGGESIPVHDLQRAEARHAFKGAWRVHLYLVSGGRRESALTRRNVAEAAVLELRRQLAIGPSGQSLSK